MSVGLCHLSLLHYEQARSALTEGLQIAQRIGDRATEASDLGNLGEVSLGKGAWEDALDFANRRLEASGP